MTNLKQLKAGAGISVIDFPDGYFPHDRFRGVYDDIHARAIYLEQDEKILIISAELPSIRPFELIDGIRGRLSEQLDIPLKNVWFCATHDLTAPHVPAKASDPVKFNIHLEAINRAVFDAAAQAVGSAGPSLASLGKGLSNVNTNRDIPSNQGWWFGLNGPGPVDRELYVLKFESPDYKPIGFIYHYAVKSNTVEDAVDEAGERYVTSELTGHASKIIEARCGAPCMFLMGAAADLVPRLKGQFFAADENGDLVEHNLGKKGYEYVESLGAELGQNIADVIDSMPLPQTPASLEVLEATWTFEGKLFERNPEDGKPQKERIYKEGPAQKLPVSILKIAGAAIIGMKPETQAEIGMKLKSKTKDVVPLVTAMVNGGMDYLPDEASFEHHTFAAAHSTFARGSAEQFVDMAASFLNGTE